MTQVEPELKFYGGTMIQAEPELKFTGKFQYLY